MIIDFHVHCPAARGHGGLHRHAVPQEHRARQQDLADHDRERARSRQDRRRRHHGDLEPDPQSARHGPQQQFERCERQNRFNAECQNKYHGQIVGMASTVPYGGDKFLRAFERAIKEDGLKGAWITSSLQGKYPDDDEAMPFFQAGARSSMCRSSSIRRRSASARSGCATIGSRRASAARWTARSRSRG
jgi:predicted TIM-barrel fold metal-dependent hydrolase